MFNLSTEPLGLEPAIKEPALNSLTNHSSETTGAENPCYHNRCEL